MNEEEAVFIIRELFAPFVFFILVNKLFVRNFPHKTLLTKSERIWDPGT